MISTDVKHLSVDGNILSTGVMTSFTFVYILLFYF